MSSTKGPPRGASHRSCEAGSGWARDRWSVAVDRRMLEQTREGTGPTPAATAAAGGRVRRLAFVPLFGARLACRLALSEYFTLQPAE